MSLLHHFAVHTPKPGSWEFPCCGNNKGKSHLISLRSPVIAALKLCDALAITVSNVERTKDSQASPNSELFLSLCDSATQRDVSARCLQRTRSALRLTFPHISGAAGFAPVTAKREAPNSGSPLVTRQHGGDGGHHQEWQTTLFFFC